MTHTPIASPVQGRKRKIRSNSPDYRIAIERALALVRRGAKVRAAVRNVGLRPKTDDDVVRRLCDDRHIRRPHRPNFPFQTIDPWPVRVPRGKGATT